MRVFDSLLLNMAFLVHPSVCPIRDGVDPNDFEKNFEIVPSTPEETQYIRIMHADGRVHKVVGNIDLIAKGQTIIGYDGHCRGHSHINLAIFNADGEPVFQNRRHRADIWKVDFQQARDWGVYESSPSEPPLPASYYQDMSQYWDIPHPRRVTQRNEAGGTISDRARDISIDRYGVTYSDTSSDTFRYTYRHTSRDRSRDRSRVSSRHTSRDRSRDTFSERGTIRGRDRATRRGEATGSFSGGSGGSTQ